MGNDLRPLLAGLDHTHLVITSSLDDDNKLKAKTSMSPQHRHVSSYFIFRVAN